MTRPQVEEFEVAAGVTPSAYPDMSGKMMVSGLELALNVDRKINATSLEPGRAESLRFETINEWTEELAAVGAQRNIVERKMRSIALNFFRYDVLQQKQKGTLLDRLARILDSNRRIQLHHLQPDHLIEKFNWLELVRLVEKEWPLFSVVFGDKTQFSSNCTIVNSRPDAHAKKADRADLAAYRNSVTWLEDALAKAG